MVWTSYCFVLIVLKSVQCGGALKAHGFGFVIKNFQSILFHFILFLVRDRHPFHPQTKSELSLGFVVSAGMVCSVSFPTFKLGVWSL